MKIFGEDYNREDLLRYCNPAAVCGVRRVTVSHGRGKGQGLLEVKTASGLRATLLEDKCLDILDLEYKGVNLGFLSKNGLINENHPETDSFFRFWQGGFLSTCGLRNVGPSCTTDGELHPLHGRIGLTPAENVNVSVNNETITITGVMRESALYGHCMELERTMEIPCDASTITVKDVVRNLTPEEAPVFVLYHLNFGFPFLSESLKVDFPEGDVKGHTAEAQAIINDHALFTAPADGIKEHVFLHTPKSERPNVRLSNPRVGVTVDISYDSRQLPILAEWRCMRAGDYALGIEPSTSGIKGREGELASGYNIKVPGFGTLEYGFTINIK